VRTGCQWELAAGDFVKHRIAEYSTKMSRFLVAIAAALCAAAQPPGPPPPGGGGGGGAPAGELVPEAVATAPRRHALESTSTRTRR